LTTATRNLFQHLLFAKVKRIKRPFWTFCPHTSYGFSQVTLTRKRNLVQNNLFTSTKTLNEDIQQPVNSRAHREENLTWLKHKLDTRKTNKPTNKTE